MKAAYDLYETIRLFSEVSPSQTTGSKKAVDVDNRTYLHAIRKGKSARLAFA